MIIDTDNVYKRKKTLENEIQRLLESFYTDTGIAVGIVEVRNIKHRNTATGSSVCDLVIPKVECSLLSPFGL